MLIQKFIPPDLLASPVGRMVIAGAPANPPVPMADVSRAVLCTLKRVLPAPNTPVPNGSTKLIHPMLQSLAPEQA